VAQVILEKHEGVDDLRQRNSLLEAALPERDVLAFDMRLGLVSDPVAEVTIEVVQAMPEIRFRNSGERWRAGVRPQVSDDCLRQFVGMSLDEGSVPSSGVNRARLP
jgi:hypothetical protein